MIEEGDRSAEDLEAAIECLLFVSGSPLAPAELARATERTEKEVCEALAKLQQGLRRRGSGLQALQIAGGWQLSTRPEHSAVVGRLLTRERGKLSRAALETVAVIAYRQPVTAPEIEAVRGVSASGVLRTLLERKLIAEAGRKPTAGRPVLYVTTDDFLHYFAINGLEELPALEEADA